MTPKTKVCSRCGRRKPAKSFNRNATHKDGLQSACRPCEAEVITRLLKLADASDGTSSVPWGGPQAAMPVHATA